MRYTSCFLAILALGLAVHTSEAVDTYPHQGDCVDSSLVGYTGLYPSSSHIISSTPAVSYTAYTQVDFALGFQVQYYQNYKVVTNNKVNDVYVLYSCGSPAPNPSAFPSGAKIFQVPLSTISVTDTTIVGFLELLGVLDRVMYSTPYAVNGCMQKLVSSACNMSADGDYAEGFMEQADTVAGVMISDSTRNTNPKTIAVSATPDPGVLNRAEWIKFLAVFFNKEIEANGIFSTINSTYNSIKTAAATYIKSGAPSPLVAWLTYSPGYGSTPASWGFSFPTYKLMYIKDAGAVPLDVTSLNATYNTGSKGVSYIYNTLTFFNTTNGPPISTLHTILAAVDIVIDESYYGYGVQANSTLFMSTWGFTNADVAAYKFLKNQKVYYIDGTIDASYSLDWFERAVAEPHEALYDLVLLSSPAALQQSGLFNRTTTRWLRNIFTSAPLLVTPSSCGLSFSNCMVDYTRICPLVFRDCKGNIMTASSAQRCPPVCTTGSLGNSASIALVQPLLLISASVLALLLAFLL